MYERTLAAAERILSTRPGTSLRVTELRDSIGPAVSRGDCEGCTLADFTALLDADPRFELLNSDRLTEDVDDDETDTPEDDLRSMGFLKAAVVRLKRRRVAADDDEEEIPSLPLRRLSETTVPKARTRGSEKKKVQSKRGRPVTVRPVRRRGSGRSR